MAELTLVELREAVERHQLEIYLKACKRISESQIDFDNYVDPRDAYRDPETGEMWEPVGSLGGYEDARGVGTGFRTEADLARARRICRLMAEENGSAQSIHENISSYVVGTGIRYQAAMKDPEAGKDLAKQAQAIIDEWVYENDWYSRQEENELRLDRDGEVFIRLFPEEAGWMVRVRTVEPGQVCSPQGQDADSFGIKTKPGDVESVLGYWIDGDIEDAALIQHRKRGVDRNCKRGVPLLWSLRRELRRIDATRRNMATVYGAQTAIAAIRKTKRSKTELETMIGAVTGYDIKDAYGGNSRVTPFRPGSVWDVDADTDVEMNAAKINVTAGKEVIQADLRACGSRLCLPEYMISGDASNANYSSTLVAEGPAVRYFERRQAKTIEWDKRILWFVIERAVVAGVLPSTVVEEVDITATPPRLAVRDEEKTARANQILHQEKVKSVRTWRAEQGLDDDTEEANLAEEADRDVGPGLTNPLSPPGDAGGPEPEPAIDSGDGGGDGGANNDES